MRDTTFTELRNQAKHYFDLVEAGETVRVLGVDPFLDRAIRPELGRSWFGQRNSSRPERSLSFLLDEKSILLDSRLADQLGLKPGDQKETSRGSLRVVGTFLNPSSEPLILMDMAQAQKLFGLPGQLDRVDLIVTDDSSFRSRWAVGFHIQSNQQRRATLSDMLQAFRLNLQALSLLALFVGVFLVLMVSRQFQS